MAIVSTLASYVETVTAATIIARARRLIGIYAPDTPMTPDEVADGMFALNSMLGTWSNERLMIHTASVDVVTVPGGKSAWTIGPGGEIDTVRPFSISPASFFRFMNIDYPLQLLTSEEYNSIALKTFNTSIPSALWFKQTYPLAEITLYPVPAAGELHLWSWKPFAEFLNAQSEVSMPPGYKDALAYNLAVAMAPEYEREASPTVKNRAAMTKKAIKRVNFEPPQMTFRPEVLHTPGFNIYKG